MNIEKVSVEDAEELLRIYEPYVTETAISFEYDVPSLEEFRERIRTISARYPYLKAVDGTQILGYAYAGTFKARRAYDWAVETSVYVRKGSHQQGVGRALYESLEVSLRRMGILNMNACISVPKDGDFHVTKDSILFHEKMGFLPVGVFHKCGYKFHTWYDMMWMEKMIGEHRTDQRAVAFGEDR